MAIAHWNLQFLNHNSQRAYPLAAWGSRTDTSSTITIPDSFILGLYLPVHAGLDVEPEKFFIQSIGIFATGYSVAIGYDGGSSPYPTVANVNISKSLHSEYQTYAMSGVGDFDDTVGKIVIGDLYEIDQLSPGYYTFEPAATPLETDTIRPMIRGISSLTIVNGSDRSQKLYGDIEIAAGTNMRIVANSTPGQPTQIVFSAISGEGLNAVCECEETADKTAIRFINGIPPLADGNFRIVGNKCISIQPITNGLQFTDLCSQPCCGCDELDAVVQQIHRFADGATTLNTFVSTLHAETSKMQSVVLGSKLADNSCIECQ